MMVPGQSAWTLEEESDAVFRRSGVSRATQPRHAAFAPPTMPAASGVNRARLVMRNSRTSARLSMRRAYVAVLE